MHEIFMPRLFHAYNISDGILGNSKFGKIVILVSFSVVWPFYLV